MKEAHLKLISNPDAGVDPIIVDKVRGFARDQLAKDAERWERERRYPREAMRIASSEFGGMRVPKALGGRGASLKTFLLMAEELAEVDISFALAFVVHGNVALIVSQSSNTRLLFNTDGTPEVMNVIIGRELARDRTEPGRGRRRDGDKR